MQVLKQDQERARSDNGRLCCELYMKLPDRRELFDYSESNHENPIDVGVRITILYGVETSETSSSNASAPTSWCESSGRDRALYLFLTREKRTGRGGSRQHGDGDD